MRKLPVSQLKPGMVLAKSIYGPDGQLWLKAGIKLLANYIYSLQRMDIISVYIDDPLLSDVTVEQIVSDDTRIHAVKTVKKTLHEMKSSVLKNGKLINNRFLYTVEKLVQEVLTNKEVIFNLDEIRHTDDYTFAHCVNVCILSLLIGSGLKLSRSSMHEIAVGALLHDLGKIWVDEGILKKEGRLTPQEFEQIKKHPVYGHEILSGQSNISPNSIKVVVQHHERCDSSGYPYKLTEEEIHDFAKLVMIADVFDALTADRPYRKAMKPHQAIEIITGCAGLYDYELVRSFLYHVAAYPVGTALRLSNGDMGLVIRSHKGMPLRPVIRVCKNGDGELYTEPFDIDLTEKLNLVITDVLDDEVRDKELPISTPDS